MKIPSPDEVIKLMNRPSYRPMRAREISKRLGVPKGERSVFKKVLKKLVREGMIERIRGGRYRVSEPNQPIPGELIGDSAEVPQGKEVKKEVTHKPQPRARMPKEGRVLGKFLRKGKTGLILPRDRKIPPLPVSLSSTKGIRGESLVVAEIGGDGRYGHRPQTAIVEVLGKAGNLEVERKSILVGRDLSEGFLPGVLRESEGIPSEVSTGDVAERVDLRGDLIFTIDNDRAKDFDDAVGISKTRSGYNLRVSIADVSHYVKLGSAIDNEALKRATSVYLPESVVPMLPEKLSNWVCSLVPNEDRLTKTVEMEFNREGSMVGYNVYNSVINSRHRLTYTGVSEMLEKKRVGKDDGELLRSLRVMKELYEKLRSRRLQRGGLDFNVSEPELIRDELGSTIDVIKSERKVANGIIEEFMIAANNAAAEYIFGTRNPSIYRIHEPPDIGSVKELAAFLRKLGYILQVDGQVEPQRIQNLVSESKDKPEEIVVNMLILRAMKRAVYSTRMEGHFGLALDHYTHFTSPIRRYPDLVVHRIVDSLIKKRRPPYDEESLDWIASHSSTRERAAVEVEREAVELERVYMMKSRVGKEFGGYIVSVLPFGMFVELKEVFVEGFIPREKFKKQRGKRLDVGQEIRVKVIEADVERRRITLDMVS